MLDVHPPHTPTHSWRDFLIHIATIVIGLLIAVGLEQTVEAIHRRHEVHELREALQREREENRKVIVVNAALYRLHRIRLEQDLHVFEYLRQHPGTPEEKLPGVPDWTLPYEPIITAAWKNAQGTQALVLLPREESEEDARLYDLLDKSDEAATQAAVSAIHVGNYAFADPDPSHLTPPQVDKLIDSIRELMLANWGWGLWMGNLCNEHKDFATILPKRESIGADPWNRSASDKEKLAPAAAQTQQAIAAARAAVEDAEKTTGLH